jgi:hypothetical protein
MTAPGQVQTNVSGGVTAIDLVSTIAASHPWWRFTFVTYEVESSSMEEIRPLISREFLRNLNSLWELLGKETIRGLGGIIPRDRHWEVGWNSILGQSIDEWNFAPAVDIVLKHEAGRQESRGFEMKSEEINSGSLTNIVESLAPNYVLALCSTCKSPQSEVLHLPLMDFRCAPNLYFRSLVTLCLRRLGQRDGVIVRSGRSYHYYGLTPCNVEEWRQFMATCLLLAPLTDARYIAHRLKEGLGVLRLSSAGSKSATPLVECLLSDPM